METEERLVRQIREAVLAGELPSAVFRRLLQAEAGITKYDLGVSFIEAFSPVDSVVWNIVAHWRYRENSAIWDRRTDFELLNEVTRAGVQLPWSAEHVERERMEAWRGSDESSKRT